MGVVDTILECGEKRCVLFSVALALSMVMGCCATVASHATCRHDVIARFMLLRCLVSPVSVCVFLFIGMLAAVARPVALLLHAGTMLCLGLPILSGAVSYPYCEPGMWQEEDDALSHAQPLWPLIEMVPIVLLVISDCLIAVFSTVALLAPVSACCNGGKK